MKVVLLSGSNIGTKTRKALDYVNREIEKQFTNVETVTLDLAERDMQFCDGQNYTEYEGDTKYVIDQIIEADAVIIGTPIFQASIPAALKNVFDLLPQQALLNKVVSFLVTAGSSKHYLVAEQQLKPILSFMKAQIVHSFVFIEEKDFYQYEIINENVLARIPQLAEDTIMLAESYQRIKQVKEEQI